jgi:hypothetical protein
VLCRDLGIVLNDPNDLLMTFKAGTLRCKACGCLTWQIYIRRWPKLTLSAANYIARAAKFRGYGPATLAATGALALVSAAAQSYWLKSPEREIGLYLAIWIATAAVSVIIIGIQTIRRAQRVHLGLAKEMIHSAAEQFLPALVAGLLLTVVLLRYATLSLWMLPGLWQVIFSLGVFSSCQFLPRPIFAVGVWYLAAGLTCLALGSGEWALSPWEMGVPFGVGQVLVAAVLHYGEADDQS